MPEPIPTPSAQTGLRALKAMLRERHPLAAMQVFHDELGDVFRPQLPGFRPTINGSSPQLVLEGGLNHQ